MRMRTSCLTAAAAGVFSVGASFAQVPAEEHKIVIGPTNLELYNGAMALQADDGEEGVRLTLLGLQHAASDQERLTGMSNLCAGYLMLQQFDEALEQCNLALAADPDYWPALTNRASIYVLTGRYDAAETDLLRAEELAPSARSVKEVRQLFLDKTNPVEPSVTIDDRRDTDDDPESPR